MAKPKSKWDFRDVSLGLQMLREFLLGRRHNLHGRFPPKLASRSIPPPDIPRGPEYKYSKQYYFERSAADSVLPPVVAPVAEGPPLSGTTTSLKPNTLVFACAPTPGMPWWWDGHCFYECKPDPPVTKQPCCQPSPCPQPEC